MYESLSYIEAKKRVFTGNLASSTDAPSLVDLSGSSAQELRLPCSLKTLSTLRSAVLAVHLCASHGVNRLDPITRAEQSNIRLFAENPEVIGRFNTEVKQHTINCTPVGKPDAALRLPAEFWTFSANILRSQAVGSAGLPG